MPPVQLSPLPLTAGVFRFAFNGLPAVLYIIEYRSTLTSGSWTELERRFGAGGLEIVTDKTASGAARFYRVRSLYAPPPSMSAITMSGGALSFSFATVSGAVYVIQYKERLEDPAWLELSRQTGTGAPQQITDVTPDAASRFYRVEVR